MKCGLFFNFLGFLGCLKGNLFIILLKHRVKVREIFGGSGCLFLGGTLLLLVVRGREHWNRSPVDTYPLSLLRLFKELFSECDKIRHLDLHVGPIDLQVFQLMLIVGLG